MRLLLDSFSRSVAYCMHPRVIVLSLLPLGLMVVLAAVFGYFFWDATVAWTREALDAWPLLASFWGWLGRFFSGDVTAVLAPMVVVLAATPLIVVLCLLIVAGLMATPLTRLVAVRRFPTLEEKKGASFIGSAARSLGLTLLALLALVVSMPLWLIPPLVLILPPLIWGWLTYRVMSFDALAEHASPEERAALLRIHRLPLLGIGIVCGYLGAAPSIVWASGLIFAAAFFVLVPLAIWIYTLVFAFSGLWFAHYCLDALARLRAQRAALAAASAVADREHRYSSCDNTMGRTMSQSFGLLVIGDEILSGKRLDKHMPKVIEMLAARGHQLAWAEYVGDVPARITAALARAFASGDIVFSTGGIGATPDDHTRQCAAAALGVPLALHPEAELLIRERMQDTAREQGTIYEPDRADNVHRLNMGVFPLGANIIRNGYNKIPGFSVGDVHFLPGFPVMAWPMIESVLDERYPHLFTHQRAIEKSVIVFGAMEASLTPLMEAIELAHPGVRVFSLPSVDHPEYGRHIELGVKGEAAFIDTAYAQLLAGLHLFGATLGPEVVR